MNDEDRPPALGRPEMFLFAVALLAVVGALLLPELAQARRAGNETSAIGALKTIFQAESVFRETDREKDGNLDYGMLSELTNTGLLDAELGSGTKQGYLFQATYSFSTSEYLWFAAANPEAPGRTGDRYFTANMAGVIFYTTNGSLGVDTNTCLLPCNAPLWTR
jgi:hypothetical protein